MSRPLYTSAAYTAEFSQEFELETQRLLRRRFLWFTAIVAAMGLFGFAGGMLGGMAGGEAPGGIASEQLWKFYLIGVPWVLMYVLAFAWVVYDKPLGKILINVSILVVTVDGLLNLVSRDIGMPYSIGLAGFGISHVIAALFLPWTPVQAMKSAAIVLIANALTQLVIKQQAWTFDTAAWVGTSVTLLLSPLVAAPGVLICALRHSSRTQKFKTKFLQARYGDLRRELVDAKRIHESLFPEPGSHGGITVSYTYEPARAIGGDFLFVHREHLSDGRAGSLSLVVVDVTGHGIPAALTVNRLHGELTRIYAETPDAAPGDVMDLVNRYVHLTLARHSIYATGLCLRINADTQSLDYTSAGHPPAFIRAVDGTIEDLESTAIVLGAAPPEAFEHGQRSVRFFAGDALLAYTDGVTEARSAAGSMLQIDGVRASISQAGSVPPGEWPLRLRQRVEEYRGGGPEDDLLIVELRRGLDQAKRREAKAGGKPAGVGAR